MSKALEFVRTLNERKACLQVLDSIEQTKKDFGRVHFVLYDVNGRTISASDVMSSNLVKTIYESNGVRIKTREIIFYIHLYDRVPQTVIAEIEDNKGMVIRKVYTFNDGDSGNRFQIKFIK